MCVCVEWEDSGGKRLSESRQIKTLLRTITGNNELCGPYRNYNVADARSVFSIIPLGKPQPILRKRQTLNPHFDCFCKLSNNRRRPPACINKLQHNQ